MVVNEPLVEIAVALPAPLVLAETTGSFATNHGLASVKIFSL